MHVHYIMYICQMYVIYRLQTDPRFQTPMLKLTFYRVLAELGISIRFMFSPVINHELCGNYGGCDSIRGMYTHLYVCPRVGFQLFFVVKTSVLIVGFALL
jgi:hypothetical protein